MEMASAHCRGRFEVALLGGVVGLVVLGSLTPYQLDPGRFDGAWALSGAGWSRFDLADALVNFLVYLPVGAAAALCVLRMAGRFAAVAAGLLSGLALSLLMETMQTALVGRYASGYDVALNALGALFGGVAMTEIAPLARRAGDELAYRLHAYRVGSSVQLAATAWLALLAAVAWNGAIGLLQCGQQAAAFRVQPVPFGDTLQLPFTAAALRLLPVFGGHLALAIAAAALWRRVPGGRRVLMAGLTVVAIAVGVVDVRGTASGSDLAVAVPALVLGWVLCRRVQARIAEYQRAEAAAQAESLAVQQRLAEQARRRAFGPAMAPSLALGASRRG